MPVTFFVLDKVDVNTIHMHINMYFIISARGFTKTPGSQRRILPWGTSTSLTHESIQFLVYLFMYSLRKPAIQARRRVTGCDATRKLSTVNQKSCSSLSIGSNFSLFCKQQFYLLQLFFSCLTHMICSRSPRKQNKDRSLQDGSVYWGLTLVLFISISSNST